MSTRRTVWGSFVLCALIIPVVCAAGVGRGRSDSGAVDESLRRAIEERLYRWNASGAVYSSENAKQRLAVEYESGETRLTHPGGRVAFRLRGYGYGERLRHPAAVQAKVSGNRIEYERGGLREWYVNEAGGVEQGFTVEERPGRARDGEGLVIALEVRGELRPQLSGSGDAVLLESEDGAVLRYGGLRALDARGREVGSRFDVRGEEVRLVVEDRGAEYPLVVDPTWTQQAELTESAGAANGYFGFSVAVSGTTAVVGAVGRTVGSNIYQGAAYVFVQSGGAWTQQAELTAADGAAGDLFGWSVALSGTTAVVGAPFRQVGSNYRQGAAYVFVQSGGAWTQQAELTPSDVAAWDTFGYSVAVSGTTAVVGALYHNVGSNANQGVAYVFVQSGGAWAQQAELTASDGAPGDLFGYSVAVSGTTAVVGATAHVGSNNNQGAAYVFVQSGGAWTQQAELTAWDGAPRDYFGVSVALSGTTAVVGAIKHTVGSNPEQGAAYVFVQSGGAWTQQAELTAADGAAGDWFGVSVAVSGTTAVVGAFRHPVGSKGAAGAAYVFVQCGGYWTQQAELTASDGGWSDNFGISVAMSGTTAVVGANQHNNDEGAAYVYSTPVTIAVNCAADRDGSAYQVRYLSNLNVADSYVNIANVGASNGNDPAGRICANVYVFDPNEEPVSCCACPVTPNGLVSLSARNALVRNPLTFNNPSSVVVKIVFSALNGGTCNAGQLSVPAQLPGVFPADASALGLASGGAAWAITAHPYIAAGQAIPTKYQLTETPFFNAELSPTEYVKLVSICNFMQTYASGFGLCKGCQAGAMGAGRSR